MIWNWQIAGDAGFPAGDFSGKAVRPRGKSRKGIAGSPKNDQIIFRFLAKGCRQLFLIFPRPDRALGHLAPFHVPGHVPKILQKYVKCRDLQSQARNRGDDG
ncbi:hypothetical protein [Gemmobacter denitrificans]|uniref:DDE family transposase n=1 Tax=Gemmobacter denitrificans TaxID=3123040 RepID=A0ABU8BS85_9RHOB